MVHVCHPSNSGDDYRTAIVLSLFYICFSVPVEGRGHEGKVSCSPDWLPICFIVKGGLELLPLLHAPLKYWDHRRVPSPLCSAGD